MLRWHVIRSKHRNEDLLCHQLHCRNIEVYYPCITKRKVQSHARKITPYFPGYLFAHVDLNLVGESVLQWIPGAIGLVRFGGDPAWVSDGILQAIQTRVDQLNAQEECILSGLKAGDDITIQAGPFRGYRGIFSSYLSDHERVIVFLQFVRDQQIRVEIPVGQISLLKHAQARY